MKKGKSKIWNHIQIILIVSLVPLLMNCEVEKPIISKNNPPTIDNFDITPNEVAPGDSAEIRVMASDLDGDRLKYGYSKTGGTITDPDSSVTLWIAPKETGTYTITAIVNDGKESVKESKAIAVINNPPSIENIIYKSEVPPGDSVEIRVIASDPDGDNLTYTFTPYDEKGIITIQSLSETIWIAPQEGGNYPITITVSDGFFSVDTIITIYVIPIPIITITYPCDGDSLTTRTPNAKGEYFNMEDRYYIWLAVFPDSDGVWYPQGDEITGKNKVVFSNGKWSSPIVIGPVEGGEGEGFNVAAMIVEKDGEYDRELKNTLIDPGWCYNLEFNDQEKVKAFCIIHIFRK